MLLLSWFSFFFAGNEEEEEEEEVEAEFCEYFANISEIKAYKSCQ